MSIKTPKVSDTVATPTVIECIICRLNTINTVILPCCHAIMCTNCAQEYIKRKTKKALSLPLCPACYSEIEEIRLLRLHLISLRKTSI